jgi:hypothetical protein
MISSRREALREEIEELETAAEIELNRKRAELARLEALPDFGSLVDGTVVALTVTYGRSRPYVVVAYKTGGRWYLTGERSPNGVDSEELATWLTTSGRRLGTAAVLAEIETVTVGTIDLGAALFSALLGE